jgi:type I restriction enzyme S subunit
MSDIDQQHIEGDTDSGLPEGWTIAKLGDLCAHPQYGWTTSANKNGTGLKLLRTTDISGGTVNWSMVPFCAEEPNDPEKYLLETGDILVSRAGSVGLSYLVKECPQAIFASYLIRFRPKPSIESEFITLFLKSPEYWASIVDQTSGIAIPNVNASKLKELEVPLPPLPEQKRIVAKVEELLARVISARKHLAKVSIILKRFRQAVLAAACSGRLTSDWRDNATRVTPVDQTIHEILQQREEEWIKANISKKYKRPQDVRIDGLQALPEGWKYISSDTLISFVTSGSRGWAKYYVESGPIFIRVGNLDHDTISPNFTGVQHVNPPAGQERDRTRTQLGDILISITADVGMIALLQDEIGKAYVNQHVSIVRPVKNTFRPYLAWYLASREGGQAQFQDLQRGATKVGLGLDDIKSVAIPFPPIEEQQEIVRRVESMFKLADAVEKRVAFATARAKKLTRAILAKAFRGELVPTEAELARRERRPYESASELLARIKSERESKQASQKVFQEGGR